MSALDAARVTGLCLAVCKAQIVCRTIFDAEAATNAFWLVDRNVGVLDVHLSLNWRAARVFMSRPADMAKIGWRITFSSGRGGRKGLG